MAASASACLLSVSSDDVGAAELLELRLCSETDLAGLVRALGEPAELLRSLSELIITSLLLLLACDDARRLSLLPLLPLLVGELSYGLNEIFELLLLTLVACVVVIDAVTLAGVDSDTALFALELRCVSIDFGCVLSELAESERELQLMSPSMSRLADLRALSELFKRSGLLLPSRSAPMFEHVWASSANGLFLAS